MTSSNSRSPRLRKHLSVSAFIFLLVVSVGRAGSPPAAPPGMVLIPGGEFLMGSEEAYAAPNEKPAHRVRISSFFMDERPVTNKEFVKFVDATGYRTVAERPVDWEEIKKQLPEGTPKPPDHVLQPGSLVFRPTDGPVPLDNMARWWVWTVGANWRHPEGPGSNLEGRWDHPVVQVAWEDAVAYANWAGKRLPTEAEWEFAARGGLEGKRYAWGDEEIVGEKYRTNRWTGQFPYLNDKSDGYEGTSPVGTFPPNGYGLYDMGGNVWNWCSDIYHGTSHAQKSATGQMCCDPQGPEIARETSPLRGDPSPPEVPGALRRVTKGGSFLCSPSYCESYRPSARRGTPPDTGSSHVGFRCAKSLPTEPVSPD